MVFVLGGLPKPVSAELLCTDVSAACSCLDYVQMTR